MIQNMKKEALKFLGDKLKHKLKKNVGTNILNKESIKYTQMNINPKCIVIFALMTN
jgi:hypothetical protein